MMMAWIELNRACKALRVFKSSDMMRSTIMPYALLQKQMLPPTVEQLKRAFSVWPALTEIDAQTAANDAFGILLKGLQLEQATLLHETLQNESVETEIVKWAGIMKASNVLQQ